MMKTSRTNVRGIIPKLRDLVKYHAPWYAAYGSARRSANTSRRSGRQTWLRPPSQPEKCVRLNPPFFSSPNLSVLPLLKAGHAFACPAFLVSAHRRAGRRKLLDEIATQTRLLAALLDAGEGPTALVESVLKAQLELLFLSPFSDIEELEL